MIKLCLQPDISSMPTAAQLAVPHTLRRKCVLSPRADMVRVLAMDRFPNLPRRNPAPHARQGQAHPSCAPILGWEEGVYSCPASGSTRARQFVPSLVPLALILPVLAGPYTPQPSLPAVPNDGQMFPRRRGEGSRCERERGSRQSVACSSEPPGLPRT